jgi:hypothetical protein
MAVTFVSHYQNCMFLVFGSEGLLMLVVVWMDWEGGVNVM